MTGEVMTDTRKQEIISDLQLIVNSFVPTLEEPKITMFYVISTYNATGSNAELIGGSWARQNGINLVL